MAVPRPTPSCLLLRQLSFHVHNPSCPAYPHCPCISWAVSLQRHGRISKLNHGPMCFPPILTDGPSFRLQKGSVRNAETLIALASRISAHWSSHASGLSHQIQLGARYQQQHEERAAVKRDGQGLTTYWTHTFRSSNRATGRYGQRLPLPTFTRRIGEYEKARR